MAAGCDGLVPAAPDSLRLQTLESVWMDHSVKKLDMFILRQQPGQWGIPRTSGYLCLNDSCEGLVTHGFLLCFQRVRTATGPAATKQHVPLGTKKIQPRQLWLLHAPCKRNMCRAIYAFKDSALLQQMSQRKAECYCTTRTNVVIRAAATTSVVQTRMMVT